MRELFQRQLISKLLKKIGISKRDVIIHSDCDEIPRNTIIRNLNDNSMDINALIELKAYSTKLNLYDGMWARVRVVSGANYKSIAKLRQDIFLYNNYHLRRHKLPFMMVPDFWTHRFYGLHNFPQIILRTPKLRLITNGGWHFNNLFDFEQIIEKIINSSHYEWNTDEVMKNLKQRYLLGQDIYTGKQKQVVPIDNSFPTYILQNMTKWSNYILVDHDS
jgi:hypothetical protein